MICDSELCRFSPKYGLGCLVYHLFLVFKGLLVSYRRPFPPISALNRGYTVIIIIQFLHLSLYQQRVAYKRRTLKAYITKLRLRLELELELELD
jgi:hypothetical protein